MTDTEKPSDTDSKNTAKSAVKNTVKKGAKKKGVKKNFPKTPQKNIKKKANADTQSSSPRRSRLYHGAFIAFEILFVAVLALAAVLLYGGWLIYKNPLDIGFAKPYLEAQLSYPERDITTTLDGVELHWPDLKGPILVGLSGVHLHDAQNREILTVDDAALGLSRLRLMVGKVAPTALIIKNVTLNISRSADNKVDFGFLKQDFITPKSTAINPVVQDSDTLESAAAKSVSQPALPAEDAPQKRTQSDIIAHIMSFIADTDDKPDGGASGAKTHLNESPLAHLEILRLDDARLRIDDDVLNAEWYIPRFDITAMRTPTGMRAQYGIHMHENTTEPHMRGVFDFDRAAFETNAALDFNDVNLADIFLKAPSLSVLKGQKGTLNGALNIRLDRALALLGGGADLKLNEGVLALPDTLRAPLSVDNVHIKGDFTRRDIGRDVVGRKGTNITPSYTATLSEGAATLGGVPVEVMGRGVFDAHNFDIPLQIAVPRITQETLKSLWVKGMDDAPITQWLTRKISSGTFSDIRADLRIVGASTDDVDVGARVQSGEIFSADIDVSVSENVNESSNQNANENANQDGNTNASAIAVAVPDKMPSKTPSKKWSVTTKDINADFTFADTTVAFLDRLGAAKKAFGKGRLNSKSDTFRIDVNGADISGLKVKDGVVVLSEVMAQGRGGASIKLPVTAELADVFRFIAQKRIGVNHGLDEKAIKGTAAFTADIDIPTFTGITMDSIKLTVEGDGSGAALPAVIKGGNLTDMTYNVALKNGVLDVSGKGALNGRAADITYSRALDMGNKNKSGAKTTGTSAKPYKTKITAALMADTPLLQKLGADVSDYIDGNFQTSVVYTQTASQARAKDSPAAVTLTADTSGATFKIAPFGYAQKGGADSRVDLTLHLKNDALSHIDALNVRAPELTLKNGVVNFVKTGKTMQFSALDVTAVTLGESKGALILKRSPAGTLDFTLNGDVFDLRPFLEKSNNKRSHDNPPVKINITAKRILTNGNNEISDGKITADMDAQGRFNRLSVDAAAGRGALSVRYAPNADGRRVFDLNAADAGAALNVFGVYGKVRDGALMIHGESETGADGDRTIRGVAHMTNFRVRKAPVLGRLLSALSLPGVLQLVEGDGVIFEKMATDFSWQYAPGGSLIRLKNGRTSGNSLGLTFDGTIDNAAQNTNVKGTIIPLSGLNKTISSIPLIGDILTGGSGSVFAATYTIKGKTTDPEVFVNPLSVLTPGILRRILFEGETK